MWEISLYQNELSKAVPWFHELKEGENQTIGCLQRVPSAKGVNRWIIIASLFCTRIRKRGIKNEPN